MLDWVGCVFASSRESPGLINTGLDSQTLSEVPNDCCPNGLDLKPLRPARGRSVSSCKEELDSLS